MLTFEIEYRPDLKTFFYAELWSTEAFFVKRPDEKPIPCEIKGDVWRIGCRYKIDVLQAYWAGWEGTQRDDARLLWVAPAARPDMPPAPHVKLILPGVNIARWVEADRIIHAIWNRSDFRLSDFVNTNFRIIESTTEIRQENTLNI